MIPFHTLPTNVVEPASLRAPPSKLPPSTEPFGASTGVPFTAGSQHIQLPFAQQKEYFGEVQTGSMPRQAADDEELEELDLLELLDDEEDPDLLELLEEELELLLEDDDPDLLDELPVGQGAGH